jgi:hypothetical protein
VIVVVVVKGGDGVGNERRFSSFIVDVIVVGKIEPELLESSKVRGTGINWIGTGR